MIHSPVSRLPVSSLTPHLALLFFSLGFLATVSPSHAQWATTYGRRKGELTFSVQQTGDGGYAMAGYTWNPAGDVADVWVVKVGPTGDIEWQKTYGGEDLDVALSFDQTLDGGYIVAGYTGSYDTGGQDVLVLKLDPTGGIDWQRTYGGISNEYAHAIRQTMDGGYVLAGYTESFGAGYFDFWILKLDGAGDIEWQKTCGGTGDDRAYSIEETPDGGYIVAGYTASFGEDPFDYWLLKLDPGGEIEWQRAYGRVNGHDEAHSVMHTDDGGYIIAGVSWTYDQASDIWVLKIDDLGDIEWQKTYGGEGWDMAFSVGHADDGGYITAGTTTSFDVESFDAWVLKLDGLGDIEWQKTYGGKEIDAARSVRRTDDGGYIVAGYTDSFGAGYRDAGLLKLNADGTIDSSCGFIRDTDISGIPSSASITSTGSSASDTFVKPLDAGLTAAVANFSANVICGSEASGVPRP